MDSRINNELFFKATRIALSMLIYLPHVINIAGLYHKGSLIGCLYLSAIKRKGYNKIESNE